MKLKLFSTLTFSVAMFVANAQMGMPTSVPQAPPVNQDAQKAAAATQTTATTTVTKTEANAKSSIGSLISQYSGQINPSALTDDFNKGKAAFQNQAKGASDVKTNSTLLQKLAAGLKSPAFNSAWAKVKDKWLSNVKGATTNKQLGDALKMLSDNVNPASMSATWEKVKPTFTAALAKL